VLPRLFALVVAALLTCCGGNGSSPGIGGGDPSPPALALNGVAVIKFRAAGTEWAVLSERLRPLEDLTAPDRRLLLARDGNQAPTTITPATGWSLVDFALHPSGNVTLVLATDKELRLQRRAATGELIGEFNFTDDQAPFDPFVGNIARIEDSQSLVPRGTRDAVRVAPVGDDLVLALRTGRNAVLVERLAFTGASGFERRWRTLVEPGVPIDVVRLTSGSFDPFASLDNQWHVALDVDEQGRSAVAVTLEHTELPVGHGQYFGESVDPALISGTIVTVVDATGVRLSATVVDTQVSSEVHVVRWVGNAVLVGGRILTTRRSDGGGWDGLLVQVTPGDPVAHLQALDFDRGDVILDVIPLRDGRIAIVGSSGYTQNPTGGSISENADPLLAVLAQIGASAQRVTLTSGPRHNQVRTVGSWDDRYLMGGLQNGPGTHSADGDPALLTCDGFLREQEM
jgi:hypothetical protein